MPIIVPFFVVLALPILEIATFIYVGQWIGVWKTIGLIILSTVAGIMILRSQGLSALKKVNSDLRRAKAPEAGIIDGFIIVIASILLIIPGFLTDLVGLLLIIPPIRQLIWRFISSRIRVRTGSSGFQRGPRNGDFVDLSPEDFRRQGDNESDNRRIPGQD